MASFGHVAVGLLLGQLHGGGGERAGDQRPPLATMLAFAGLAMLPDADVIMVAFGTSDRGVLGHRGASHSFPVALVLGLLIAYVMQRYGWPVVRTAVMATAAIASHAVLDVLGEGGRGLPLLYPFSEMRFQSPVRIFPDAPRWPATLSGRGITNIAIEMLVFSPLTIYALWPRLATNVLRLVRRRPAVELVVVNSSTTNAGCLGPTGCVGRTRGCTRARSRTLARTGTWARRRAGGLDRGVWSPCSVHRRDERTVDRTRSPAALRRVKT